MVRPSWPSWERRQMAWRTSTGGGRGMGHPPSRAQHQDRALSECMSQSTRRNFVSQSRGTTSCRVTSTSPRESEDMSGRRPDDTHEANCLVSLASRRKNRSGAAPPATRYRTDPADRPIQERHDPRASLPRGGARIEAKNLGHRTHPPWPPEYYRPGPESGETPQGPLCGSSSARFAGSATREVPVAVASRILEALTPLAP